MLKYEKWDLIKRKIRKDDLPDLGVLTTDIVSRLIDDGRPQEAKEMIDYAKAEFKLLHDLYVDWTSDILDKVAKHCGEEAMYGILRKTQGTWMMRRTWQGLLKMSPLERLWLNAEVFRGHCCGQIKEGELEINEDEEKYTITFDPCGAGGRTRRGDPVTKTPSRYGPPYNFGRTTKEHAWSWSKKDVPYYCTHCAVNEILMIEWGEWPLWVTDYDEDDGKPCRWHFYKDPKYIPEKYWTRLGFEKPEKFR